MTPDDMNVLIDAHLQPLTDEDMKGMTNPPSKIDGEKEEKRKTQVLIKRMID